MKRFRCPWMFVLLLLGILSGCATGKVLTIPDGLARVDPQTSPRPAGPPAVAVLDFSWAGTPTKEIGRDYDHARPIVWDRDTGKMMADLIAAVLAEKGIPAVRAAGEADVPADVPARVWGSVEQFRVNARRAATIKVETVASTALKIQGTGPGVPSGWTGTVSSTLADTDPTVSPWGVYDVLNGAANAAAEEAVRRLLEAGVVSVPK